jgi:conjugative transfer signal peptidase TraF
MSTGTPTAQPLGGPDPGSILQALRIAGPLTLLAACWFSGLRLNLTGSQPVGLYLVSRTPVGRGALVLVCLPPSIAAFAKQRGYIAQGGACPGGLVPVGKTVCAVPGDTVTITTAGLLVNGELLPNSRPLTADHRGQPLPQLAFGAVLVRAKEVWVWSSYSPFSFDSRYFGPVPLDQVRANVRPLWTSERENVTSR